jgi:hypothetical protein
VGHALHVDTIAGAGIPPSAALSPGIPSSAGDPNAPPTQSGCRHPNIAHPGSSWAAGRPAAVGVAFAAAVAHHGHSAIAAATAVLVSVPRTLDAITRLICLSTMLTNQQRHFRRIKGVSSQGPPQFRARSSMLLANPLGNTVFDG